MPERHEEVALNEGWQLNQPLQQRGQVLQNHGQIHLTPTNIKPSPPPPSVPQNKKQ
jgi:hypothetical protein